MTGARNENSVLFSLDALKAGITASPSAQQKPGGRKAPATPRKKLEDLMGGASTHAAGPVASNLVLGANQALLTAPAPPPPKPKPEPVVVAAPVAVAAVAAPPPPKKKMGMVIGIIAAIVGSGVVAGITVVALGGKNQPAPVVSAAPVPSTPVVAAVVAPPPEAPKAAESAAAEAKPAESAAASSTSASGAKPSAAPGPKIATGGGPGPAAAGTPKAEPKKEPKKEEPAAAISSGAASFNKDAAAQALSVAASQTSICKKPDGPTGSGKVQVTFAPSGRATTANIVSGPFGGTAVGGCVSGVFKRARVPPFAGDPVTVSKSFSITP